MLSVTVIHCGTLPGGVEAPFHLPRFGTHNWTDANSLEVVTDTGEYLLSYVSVREGGGFFSGPYDVRQFRLDGQGAILGEGLVSDFTPYATDTEFDVSIGISNTVLAVWGDLRAGRGAPDVYGRRYGVGDDLLSPRAIKYYYHGGQRVAMRTAEGVYYLHADHLGSTSLSTDSTGALVTNSATRYYPYGSTRSGGSGLPTPYRFTNQYSAESSLGLYFYNARWYDPYLGRFLSADTLVPQPGNPQSLNRYAYTLNNPLRYTDPSGHALEDGYGILWRFTLSGELRAINLFPPGAGHSDRDLTYFAVMQAHAMANSTEVRRMAFANRTVVDKVYSYPKFYSLVADGRRWDIKDQMLRQLGESFRLCSRYACHWYEYSVLGNILYGFTGAEAGFSERELRIGAGYAEARDPENKDKRNWPSIWPIAYLPPERRPYYYDDPQDYHAVGMGIEMSRRYGADVTIREFQALLVDYHERLARGTPIQGPVPGWPYAPGDFDNR